MNGQIQFGLRKFLIVWTVIGVLVGTCCLISRHLADESMLMWIASLLFLFGAVSWLFCIILALLIIFNTGSPIERRHSNLKMLAKIYVASLLVTFVPPLMLLWTFMFA